MFLSGTTLAKVYNWVELPYGHVFINHIFTICFFCVSTNMTEFTNGEALRNTIRVASMFSGQNVLAQYSGMLLRGTHNIGPQWHNTFTTQILPCTPVTRKHLQFIMFTVRFPLLQLSLYSMLMRQTQWTAAAGFTILSVVRTGSTNCTSTRGTSGSC